MSKALYRKYRSKTLDEIVGQNHITDILLKSIKKGSISHAYLLTGPRGVGKTSVARILAHEINNLPYNDEESHLDIIEIDAASNNGVEDIRDLREKVQIAPFSAIKKIYIIDEVHMLSKSAFNALLKTLEEPPEHVVFILATTNIEKLPATIISRTQRYSFRPISINDAVKHLADIAKKEGIKVSSDALKLIAEHSDGSFRDSISLLDQLSSLVGADKKEITPSIIENLIGVAPNSIIDSLLKAVEDNDLNTIISLIDQSISDGVDIGVFVSQLTNRLSQKIVDNPKLISILDGLIDVPKSPQPKLKLITVLGLNAVPKNTVKSSALLAPVKEVTATIAELEIKATQEKPRESRKTPKSAKPCPFDWNKLITYTKDNHVALYSVLNKCSHKLDNEILSIYTNSKFYKKKLDDKKYSSLLSRCLQEIGAYGLDVHTEPTSIPPTNKTTAIVTAIMGGGEEVSLDSI